MAMTYQAPLRDLRFVYYELFDGEALTKLPGFEDATSDVVEAVLEEMGKIASEVMQPLNASGDEEGCHLENGAVRTPRAVSVRPRATAHTMGIIWRNASPNAPAGQGERGGTDCRGSFPGGSQRRG